MIIDLRKIVRSGREEESFFYEYDSPVKPDIPDGELVLPVKVSGTATITGNHSVYIECEITFTVKGCCTRCLNLLWERIPRKLSVAIVILPAAATFGLLSLRRWGSVAYTNESFVPIAVLVGLMPLAALIVRKRREAKP